MTALYGWGMFLFSITAFFILALCSYVVIKEVIKERKKNDE
jgi:large-conductance mechanosensitive channel|tara:strand:- start:1244 stop:1366 length:123 start_codon:yes stop_codon:yes gene_type:complete